MKYHQINLLFLILLSLLLFQCKKPDISKSEDEIKNKDSSNFEKEEKPVFINTSSSSIFLAIKNNNKWGYINEKGELIIDPVFDEAYEFSENLAVVNKNGKYGFINREGKLIIKPEYDYATKFSFGVAGVAFKKGEDQYSFGFINKENKVVLPIIYDEIIAPDTLFSEILIGKKDNKVYIFNKASKRLIYEGSAIVNSYGLPSEGLMQVLINNYYGFIDLSGDTLIAPLYEEASSFSEGLAAVKKDGKWGFINKKGEVIIPFLYDNAQPFKEGLAGIEMKGKFGYVNKEGAIIIPLKYSFGAPYTNGFAAVMIKDSSGNNYWGAIDKSGKQIIDFKYFELYDFIEGWAACQLPSGKWNYINLEGNLLLKESVDRSFPFKNAVALIFNNEEFSVVNKKGEFLLNGYKWLEFIYPDFWAFYIEGDPLLIYESSTVKKGWYNKISNRIIWEPTN